jgi:membrane-associated phospholipid phosphatase
VGWTTVVSVALALAAVAVALGAVYATRPAARWVRGRAPLRRVPSWASDRVRLSVLVLVAGAVAAIALVAVFVEILDAVVDNDDLTAVDRPVVEWIAERRTGGVSSLVVAVTDIGGKVLLAGLLAVTAVTIATRLRSWRPVVLAAISGGGSAVIVAAIKAMIGRDRPDPVQRAIVESGFSFPSGHATSALVVLATVAWLVSLVTVSRTVRATAWVAAGILAVAIGLSRVYLGVHYPSDVLAGWVLGTSWLITVAVAAHLPDSPLLPSLHTRPAIGRAARLATNRPVTAFTVTACAGCAAILATVGAYTLTD